MEARDTIAPSGVLRAAYLTTNPAHAVTDPSGELRGVATDLARELARRLGVGVTFVGAQTPRAVIEAVSEGNADVGFVAYNPERVGPVEFSQPYLLVQQTFIVPETSPVTSVTHIDRPGNRIGATAGDSIALHLGRTLEHAHLVPLDGPGADEVIRMLRGGQIDAWGANRQRLTEGFQHADGLRLLPDDLYGVEQTLIVPRGRVEALEAINRFINEARGSGFIQDAIDRSGVIGIAVAPAPIN
jgi:polar amino acid transport system substrate-binding protein